MFLLGLPPESGPANIDIGAIHYENHRYLGGGDTLEAVAEANRRNDLKPGGSALFIGAGGPMGQMHVQRAIEKADGPRLVVVTDLDGGRLAYIRKRFGAMAALKGKRLETLAPDEFPSPYMMNETIKSYAPMGYDDVVVLAPVAMIVQQAMGWVADFGFVNVFAGLGIGTMADIPIDALCRGVKIVGSSGSRISDLRRILGLVEGNQLDTNRSVAAIGGLNAAQAGLKAVKDAKYPGKTIIYTQIADLPLMSLEEAPERIPELKDKLSPEGAWTKEAEAALLEKYL
jgi:threonine dehydrogenase-like Zn-dependent dehydrogenase